MSNCGNFSVLDLDAFERTNKAKGLGMSTDSGAGNLADAEITCKIFRFLQLLCEGHNLGEFLQFAFVICIVSFSLSHIFNKFAIWKFILKIIRPADCPFSQAITINLVVINIFFASEMSCEEKLSFHQICPPCGGWWNASSYRGQLWRSD